MNVFYVLTVCPMISYILQTIKTVSGSTLYLFIYLFVCLFVIIIIIIYFLWYRKDNSDCKMSISVTYPQLYYISELIIHE